MSNFHDRKDYWKPCRPGTILSVSDSKFQRDRRKFVIRTAMGVVVAGTTLLSTIFVVSRGRRDEVANRSDPSAGFGVASNQTVAATNNRSEPALVQLPKKVYTCKEIVKEVEQYVVAFREAEQGRTDQQRDLMTGFDLHLKRCGKCSLFVNKSLQNV